MGTSSSGGMGIGTIIFIVIVGYNLFFDDDDEDKKEVNIKKTDKPAVEKTIDVESVKHTAKKLIEDAKVLLKETVDEYEKDKAERQEIKASPSEETIIASDEKKEVEESKKDKTYIPSLQLPQSEDLDQPTFRTIE